MFSGYQVDLFDCLLVFVCLTYPCFFKLESLNVPRYINKDTPTQWAPEHMQINMHISFGFQNKRFA